MTDVGRVAALWRYPVKSMAAEPLAEVEVSWHGLAGDRRWAFVRGGVERSGFPWMTIRERSNMGHYRPSFADPSRPDASRTRGAHAGRRASSRSSTRRWPPSSATACASSSRTAASSTRCRCRSISTQSVAALGALVGSELDPCASGPTC